MIDRCQRWFTALLLAVSFVDSRSAAAADPPKLVLARPLGVTIGETQKLKLRGLNFTDASTVELSAGEAKVLGLKKSPPPEKEEPKQVGDMELEVEITLPADAVPVNKGPGTITVLVVEGKAKSKPLTLLVTSPGAIDAEKEPNGGFRQAHPIESGRIISGDIHQPQDVDVFTFELIAKSKVRIEVAAARYGSLLDASLTLFDAGHRTLVMVDDAEGSRDPVLTRQLPAGRYYLSLLDAHDRGSQLHLYRLSLDVSRPSSP